MRQVRSTKSPVAWPGLMEGHLSLDFGSPPRKEKSDKRGMQTPQGSYDSGLGSFGTIGATHATAMTLIQCYQGATHRFSAMGCLDSRLLSVRTAVASMVATSFVAAKIVNGLPRGQARAGIQASVRRALVAGRAACMRHAAAHHSHGASVS